MLLADLGFVQRQLDGTQNAKWLGMLAAHQAETVDTATLIEGVKVLFAGKTSLLMQLNQFLPLESRLNKQEEWFDFNTMLFILIND